MIGDGIAVQIGVVTVQVTVVIEPVTAVIQEIEIVIVVPDGTARGIVIGIGEGDLRIGVGMMIVVVAEDETAGIRGGMMTITREGGIVATGMTVRVRGITGGRRGDGMIGIEGMKVIERVAAQRSVMTVRIVSRRHAAVEARDLTMVVRGGGVALAGTQRRNVSVRS